jgi:coenzyme F420 hydrogenase subunit beta
VLESCEPCEDYSSELADISVGSQGSEEGWSSVIIRTYRGERLISELEKGGYIVTKELDNLDVIVSSCKRKRELSHAKAVRLPASTGVTEVLAPQA